MTQKNFFLISTAVLHLFSLASAAVCTTAGCVRAAGHILSIYDPLADPCQDFYQFACGRWLNENQIPDDSGSYGTFDVVRDEVTKELRVLLETDVRLSLDSLAINMSRRIYKECMDTEKLAKWKSDSVIRALHELGGMPLLTSDWDQDRFNYNKILANITRDYSDSSIFRIYVEVDTRNISDNIIHLDEVRLPLKSRHFYLNDTIYGDRIEAYKKYIQDIIDLIAYDAGLRRLPPDQLMAQLDEIVDFERKLANITLLPEDKRNSSKLYNKYSIAELTKLVPEIDWIGYFNTILPRDVSTQFSNKTQLIVAVPQYFMEIGQLLKQTDSRILANYFVWSIISGFVDFLDERFANIDQEFIKSIDGRKQKPSRWKTCVRSVQNLMGVAAGAIYVDKHFNTEDKIEIDSMVENLLVTMSKMIEDLDWMDNNTKTSAQKKVKNIIKQLGYPDYVRNATALDNYYRELSFAEFDSYLDVSLKVSRWWSRKKFRDLLQPFDRYRFDRNAATVNAFYSPNRNAIVFPAGILRPPFFHSSYPKYINYGAMGAVIGHEITHGFDDRGSQFDEIGKLENWWSDSAAKEFRHRVKCVVDQYGKYEVAEVRRRINGRLTQGENVADNGGLKQAYKAMRAYQKYLANNYGEVEPTLPGLNLTPDQAFFVSFATFWCAKANPENLLNRVLSEPHSPEEFRVIGSLSNTKQFASAFNCEPNAKLNPKKRCEVW